MDSTVLLMHHDQDRSWITDPDPAHPKERTLSMYIIRIFILPFLFFPLSLAEIPYPWAKM